MLRWLQESEEEATQAFRGRPDLQVLAAILSEDRLGGRVVAARAWLARGSPPVTTPRSRTVRPPPGARGRPPRTPYERGFDVGTAWAGLASIGHADAIASVRLELGRTDQEVAAAQRLTTVDEVQAWRRGFREALGDHLAELEGDRAAAP